MDSNVNQLPLYTVDSFTNQVFSGNPAAVCLDISQKGLAADLQQKIAEEMNISETAFIRLLNPCDSFQTSSRFGLRWFTPKKEVALCGHGTLASAAVLYKCLRNANKKLYFETLSGTLSAIKTGERIGLELPLNPPEPVDPKTMEGLLKAALGSVQYCDVQYASIPRKLIVRLADSYSRSDLEKLSPQVSRFTEVNQDVVTGVIVTLKGTKDNGAVDTDGNVYDFVSRYFAPWVGIPEDPVTGVAHTVLAGYWSKHLGKMELYARQCSARGGDLFLKIRKDGRLDLSGHATMVMQGYLNL